MSEALPTEIFEIPTPPPLPPSTTTKPPKPEIQLRPNNNNDLFNGRKMRQEYLNEHKKQISGYPDIDKYMRDHMIKIYETPPKELITTSEYKKKLKNEKYNEEMNEDVQKAVIKINEEKIKETKIETVKKYMKYMSHQSTIHKMTPMTTEQAWALDEISKKNKEWEQYQSDPFKSEFIQDGERKRFSSNVSSKFSEGGQSYLGEDRGEIGDGEYSYELIPHGRIPSWTYFDQMGEDDDEINVDVGTDSKDRSELLYTPPKMYNVSLGVKPKDIAKVYQTPPWDYRKPKQYDVSLGTGPTPHARVRASQMVIKPMEDFGEEMPPEDELTPIEIEERRLERIRLLRKDSKRWEAGTMARPTGYRDLKLSISLEGLAFESETQVNEFDIERTMAAKRGIFLPNPNTNILWPMNRDFTQELGKRKIQDFIERTWKLDKEWMYHIKFLQSHSTNYRRKYVFEVQFSTPTMLVPIPPATASVFFVFEISHYANLDETVKVHYCLEGTRFAHIPGHLPFTQKWLHGIISDKTRVRRSIDF